MLLRLILKLRIKKWWSTLFLFFFPYPLSPIKFGNIYSLNIGVLFLAIGEDKIAIGNHFVGFVLAEKFAIGTAKCRGVES